MCQLENTEKIAIDKRTPWLSQGVLFGFVKVYPKGSCRGMTAQIKIDALGGEKHTATITEIGNTDTNHSGNSKYTVALTMDCAETMLSCMNATATIVLVSSMSGFGGGRIPMT